MLNRRLLLFGGSAVWAAPAGNTKVLYEDRETSLTSSRVEKGDLWIEAKDLPKINRFEVKPQGACRGDICIPLGKDLKSKNWFNLSGFARKVQQAVANEGGLWSLGEMPVLRTGFLESRVAPDFGMPDRKGAMVQLKDFRGRKVLLLTWASW
jgi:hypothetical protein